MTFLARPCRCCPWPVQLGIGSRTARISASGGTALCLVASLSRPCCRLLNCTHVRSRHPDTAWRLQRYRMLSPALCIAMPLHAAAGLSCLVVFCPRRWVGSCGLTTTCSQETRASSSFGEACRSPATHGSGNRAARLAPGCLRSSSCLVWLPGLHCSRRVG